MIDLNIPPGGHIPTVDDGKIDLVIKSDTTISEAIDKVYVDFERLFNEVGTNLKDQRADIYYDSSLLKSHFRLSFYAVGRANDRLLGCSANYAIEELPWSQNTLYDFEFWFHQKIYGESRKDGE